MSDNHCLRDIGDCTIATGRYKCAILFSIVAHANYILDSNLFHLIDSYSEPFRSCVPHSTGHILWTQDDLSDELDDVELSILREVHQPCTHFDESVAAGTLA